MTDWAVGDRALLDNQVPGKVDGFYEVESEDTTMVVFRPDWKWTRGIWGSLGPRDEPDPGAEDIKHLFQSLIIVHPSNLARP